MINRGLQTRICENGKREAQGAKAQSCHKTCVQKTLLFQDTALCEQDDANGGQWLSRGHVQLRLCYPIVHAGRYVQQLGLHRWVHMAKMTACVYNTQ